MASRSKRNLPIVAESRMASVASWISGVESRAGAFAHAFGARPGELDHRRLPGHLGVRRDGERHDDRDNASSIGR
jgi:hypothetical protein